MDGNINLQDLNGDYKHFTALVAVPRTYTMKATYGHVIGASGIGHVYPVKKKLLALFGKGGGILGPAKAIVLQQTIQDIIMVKNPMDSKIEVVFQSGTHDLELAAMAERNVSGEEDIMYIDTIPTYMVYDGSNVSTALVYKRLWDSQHDSPIRGHALSLLRSYMMGI